MTELSGLLSCGQAAGADSTHLMLCSTQNPPGLQNSHCLLLFLKVLAVFFVFSLLPYLFQYVGFYLYISCFAENSFFVVVVVKVFALSFIVMQDLVQGCPKCGWGAICAPSTQIVF